MSRAGLLVGRHAGLLCAVLVAATALPRAISCLNDFWLDEIWTYFLARDLVSPLQVFTAIHHSNNNHLNTLLVYWLGDRAWWPIYRLPSLAAGVASVALAASIAWRRGRLEAVLAAFLTGGSFALLHFASEARGYALALGFALAALALLERQLERETRLGALAFGACAVAGLLSHLVFGFFWAGTLAWSAVRFARRGRPLLPGLARLHALPLVALAVLYAVDLRALHVGGGDPTFSANLLLARLFGFALGLPVISALGGTYAALGAVPFVLGLRRLWRRGDDAWVLYATAVVLAPLAALAVLRPEVIAVRYFLIPIALYLLLASDLLADWLRAGAARRRLALALLALFALGNALHTSAFLRLGRGGYHDALDHMAERTAGPRIVVGSNHDFRNRMVLRFYARYLPDGKRLVYTPRGQWPAGGPDWLLRSLSQRPVEPPEQIEVAGVRYAFAVEFDHAAISGFYWSLYHRAPDASE